MAKILVERKGVRFDGAPLHGRVVDEDGKIVVELDADGRRCLRQEQEPVKRGPFSVTAATAFLDNILKRLAEQPAPLPLEEEI